AHLAGRSTAPPRRRAAGSGRPGRQQPLGSRSHPYRAAATGPGPGCDPWRPGGSGHHASRPRRAVPRPYVRSQCRARRTRASCATALRRGRCAARRARPARAGHTCARHRGAPGGHADGGGRLRGLPRAGRGRHGPVRRSARPVRRRLRRRDRQGSRPGVGSQPLRRLEPPERRRSRPTDRARGRSPAL
ncbi:MAG: hypothetical protein AVDCRST_MAG50-3241, partial [uncultured Acidimicrobiales bacterium]